jgi:hypothetical protein
LKEYSGRHLQKSISTFLNLESGIHHIDLYLRLWDEAQEVLAPLSFLHLLVVVMAILELGSRIDNITQDTRKQPRKLKCSRYKWTHPLFHTPSYFPRLNRILTFKWPWMVSITSIFLIINLLWMVILYILWNGHIVRHSNSLITSRENKCLQFFIFQQNIASFSSQL